MLDISTEHRVNFSVKLVCFQVQLWEFFQVSSHSYPASLWLEIIN